MDANRQSAQRTDIAVMILGLNTPLCGVVLNVVMAPTIIIIDHDTRGLCYRQPEPGTPPKVDP